MDPAFRNLGLPAAIGALLVAGCASVVNADFDQAHVEDPASGTGGAGTGPSTGGGTAGTGAEGGGAPACPVLYVAPHGDDANSGCEPTAPLLTIGAAITKAKPSSPIPEVHVCKGTYAEALLLDAPVSLRGGYDCVGWTRTDSYGFPDFDALNETTVSSVAGDMQPPPALAVAGAAVSATTTIDGFTFRGPEAGEDGKAVSIEDEAAPVFSNNRVLGGATTSETAYGSVGLRIEGGALPEVRFNDIDGGAGTTGASGGVGRVGVLVYGARPFLHDNRISGGAAQPLQSDGYGSTGLLLRNAPDLTEEGGRPVLRNVIEGGDGYSTLPDNVMASMGAYLLGATDADFVECSIRPGWVVGTAMGMRGIESEATGALRIVRSRLYGGDLSNPAQPWLGWRVAARIVGAESLSVLSSALYGGVAGDAEFAGGSPSFALEVLAVSAPVIQHNTLYAGPSGFPTVGTALHLGGAKRAVVENNILAAAVGWNEPIFVDDCASAGTFQALRHNLMFNVGGGAEGEMYSMLGYSHAPGGSCGPWAGIATIEELEAHIAASCNAGSGGECGQFGGTLVGGNRTLKADCAGDSGCIPWPACAPSVPCIGSIFEAWSPDDGLSTLFGPGWKLDSSVPCAIAESPLDLTTSVPLDLYGLPRSKPPSMGAHELNGLDCP